MTTRSSVSEQLRRQSFVSVECTIPTEMTIDQWRRGRGGRAVPSRDGRVARLPSFLHGLALRDAV